MLCCDAGSRSGMGGIIIVGGRGGFWPLDAESCFWS